MAEDKKAPDYSNVAENLCNPPEVFELLKKLHEEQGHLEGQRELLRSQNETLCKQIETTEEIIAKLQEKIRAAVGIYGSFQDIGLGLYAVKYRRMHKEYNIPSFKEHFPEYIKAVIEESLNAKKLDGLVKGGLIKEEDLKHFRVVTEKPSYAFYVR